MRSEEREKRKEKRGASPTSFPRRSRMRRGVREPRGAWGVDGNSVVPAKAGTQEGRGRQFRRSRAGGNPGAWGVDSTSVVPAKAGTQRGVGRGRHSPRCSGGLGYVVAGGGRGVRIEGRRPLLPSFPRR